MPIKIKPATGAGSVSLEAENSISSDFTLTLPGTNGTALISNSAGNTSITGTLVMGSSFLRNRIINGDMRIDQRNAGASGTANAYTVDRWGYFGAAASKGTWQQNAGSVTPPAGFTNYLGFTSSSSYTVGASEQFNIYQAIEGLNISDLAWGTANARTINISFWVRSSLTGTFGGSIYNSAVNRSYPYSYTISAANTWEQKSVTIIGDTSGTWLTTNGVGLYLNFSLGAGSTVSNTAGSWYAGRFDSVTGATSVVGTNGATFYITGVQLEVGSVATPFERRQYGQELALCQRYFQLFGGASNNFGVQGYATAGFNVAFSMSWPVVMRASPTVVLPTMSNINTPGVVANNPNAYGVIFYAVATATGFLSSINTSGGFGTASAEL